MPVELMQGLTQFGVAGLMGALWIWERMHSRMREQQLTEAHERLMAEREHLNILMRTVQRNTAAIERFDQTQAKLHGLLEKVYGEMSRGVGEPVRG
jgi:hypothetical protein